MRVLLQRVTAASVSVDARVVARIGRGLLLFAGIAADDTDADLEQMARKVANLRIFEDAAGKMNRSALDLIAEGSDPSFGLLVVSQFTLYADMRRGRRPSFVGAASPDRAAPMIQRWAGMLSGLGFRVEQGVFGAHMVVQLSNDGPVTLWLDNAEFKRPTLAAEGR